MGYIYFSKEEAGHPIGIRVANILAVVQTETGWTLHYYDESSLKKPNILYLSVDTTFHQEVGNHWLKLSDVYSGHPVYFTRKNVEKVHAQEYMQVKEATFISVKHMLTSFVVLESVEQVIKLLNEKL